MDEETEAQRGAVTPEAAEPGAGLRPELSRGWLSPRHYVPGMASGAGVRTEGQATPRERGVREGVGEHVCAREPPQLQSFLRPTPCR